MILRDIPDSPANIEALMALFQSATLADGSHAPIPQTIRPDRNQTWFVSFNNEAEAIAALHAISNSTFAGEKVRARLKTVASSPFPPP